ncbi:MAG: DUF58 domain-containing protein [Myxococcales bacterium]|nr:DUF58 domain-containing protein [Myxococcales bacterium]
MKLDPSLLAKLGSLPVKARVIVESALSGMHRARLRGSSVEFAEHKEYSPGDELRHIDWKALAKLDRYYVKQFEQESQLTVYLVLDASGSMRFAGAGLPKVEYGALALAALAYLVSQQQDKVGLYVFGPRPAPLHVPPRAKGTHLADLLAVLDAAIADPTTGDDSPADALDRIGELARRRRALVVLASDLFDPDDRTVTALRRLRAQRHDVVALHVVAPEERTLPYEGLTMFEGLEGDHKLLANPTAIRADYVARMDAFLARTADELAAGGVDYHLTPTDRPLDQTLLAVLTARGGPRERR